MTIKNPAGIERRLVFGTRRAVLRGLGGLGVLTILDCGGASPQFSPPGGGGEHEGGAAAGHVPSLDAGEVLDAGDVRDAGDVLDGGDALAVPPDGSACVLDPTLTKGPYWIDEGLDRTDIRTDTNGHATPNPRPGLPLVLRIMVLATDSTGCTPLPGALVDVWHCDATGLYSDVSSLGTSGENFLRGFQRTDAGGAVTFTTIYPGWYAGRSVHIHVKVRLYDATLNVTTEATTQLFFDDSVTNVVCQSAAPYSARGAPDTSNARDGYFGGHTELVLALRGDPTSGYTGTITLGIPVGVVSQG
jgi:protocatechuate 3,4-dioxygenase beta subunit